MYTQMSTTNGYYTMAPAFQVAHQRILTYIRQNYVIERMCLWVSPTLSVSVSVAQNTTYSISHALLSVRIQLLLLMVGCVKKNVQETNRITKNILGNVFHLVHQVTFFLIIPTYVIIIVQKIFSTHLTKLAIQCVLKLIHLLLKEERVLFITMEPHTYQNYIMNA